MLVQPRCQTCTRWPDGGNEVAVGVAWGGGHEVVGVARGC